MDKAKIFVNGRSQAVRLPKEYRFNEEEIFVKKIGDVVLLIPPRTAWKSLVESTSEFTDDFMEERNQPKNQKRKSL